MKRYRREVAKALGLAGGAFLASSLLQKLYAQSVPEPEVLFSRYTPISPVDVIVFRDGDKAVAIDGRTKQRIYESEDHVQVFEMARDRLYDRGGGVIYLNGVFRWKKPIDFTEDKPIALIGGEPPGAIADYGTKIIYDGDSGVTVFNFNKGSFGEYKQSVRIENIAIELVGDKVWDNTKVIDATYVPNLRIRNVLIYNQGTRGTDSFGILINAPGNNTVLIEDVIIKNFYYGIDLYTDHSVLLRVTCSQCYRSFRWRTFGATHVGIGLHSYQPVETSFWIDFGTYGGQVTLIGCYSEKGSDVPTDLYINGPPDDKIGEVWIIGFSSNYIPPRVNIVNPRNVYIMTGRKYPIMRNHGVATLSGDGSTTDFLLGKHELLVSVTDPSRVVVRCTPASVDAIAASPLVCYLSDEDSDGVYESIRVKFASAPASGTNNVKIVWEVEYIG